MDRQWTGIRDPENERGPPGSTGFLGEGVVSRTTADVRSDQSSLFANAILTPLTIEARDIGLPAGPFHKETGHDRTECENTDKCGRPSGPITDGETAPRCHHRGVPRIL